MLVCVCFIPALHILYALPNGPYGSVSLQHWISLGCVLQMEPVPENVMYICRPAVWLANTNIISIKLTTIQRSFNSLYPGQPGLAVTGRINHSGFYGSRDDWVAVASTGPYAPHSRQITISSTSSFKFFYGLDTFLQPSQQHQSTDGTCN